MENFDYRSILVDSGTIVQCYTKSNRTEQYIHVVQQIVKIDILGVI